MSALLQIVLHLLAIIVAWMVVEIAVVWFDYRRSQRRRERQAKIDADLRLAWEEEQISIREHLEEQLREARTTQGGGR